MRALLVTCDDAVGRAIVETFERTGVGVDWVSSTAELFRRTVAGELAEVELVFLDLDLPDATGEEVVDALRVAVPLASITALGSNLACERAARLLGAGVPSLHKPVDPNVLAVLALQLSANLPPRRSSSGIDTKPLGALGALGAVVDAYAELQGFSDRQKAILSLYLGGAHDKEIAHQLGCSECTVYEHWRRMAKKAGGAQKACVIREFHRFLSAQGSAEAGSPAPSSAPRRPKP